LNSKLASLEQEQATLRQYKKEQQKLQDERIKRIDEEVKKYQDMYNKVQKFEQAYMQQLETDHYRQVQMTNQLIQQREAVYRAKMRAMSA
jgi:peptidoglycan hydrolase CwlO-like protein